jgi:WD40 repeat protein
VLLPIWWLFSFVVNADYREQQAVLLLLFTGGIWLILLGIHLLIRFFTGRLKKTQDAEMISHLKRTARLVLLLPWGSCLFFFIAIFVGRICWLGGDVSRLIADVDGWVFTLMIFFTTLIHLAMLVVVYGTCFPTLRLYFLLRKEHFNQSQKHFPAGIPSGCIDMVLLGFLVPGIGILLYYGILFHNSRNVVFTHPNFHAIAFLDRQSILVTTFENELAIFDSSTCEFVSLIPKIISEKSSHTFNGIPVHFFVRPRLVDENRVVVALQDDFLTLNRLELEPSVKPRKIVHEERLVLFDVDPDGEWCLAIHETGRISLTRFPDAENEALSIRWIDAPLARVENHKETSYESAYSIPFDFAFLLPRKGDSEQPNIAVVLKEGIYTVRTAPDYQEVVRTELSFPGDNENTNCRVSMSPNFRYVLLSFGRWGKQPQHRSVLLDSETGGLLMDLLPLSQSTYDFVFAFSQDSRMLTSFSLDPHRHGNATVRVWDIAAKKMYGRPVSVPRSVRDVVFSPDGRFVASPVGGRIYIWNFPQWKRQYSLPLSRMSDNHLIGFSPDGTRIFVNQYEGFSILKTAPDH